MDAPVIILGAGYAGLAAADALARRRIPSLVLEARDRVGGRTRTDTVADGLWLDIGGQWIGPGHDHLYALAARFGRRVWPMHVEGRQVLHLRGRSRTYRGLIPLNLPPLALLNLLWGFARLEWRARRVPLHAPWTAPDAARLDEQTVGDWLRRNVKHRDARAILQIAVEAVFAAHPDDVGLLHALFYLHAGGGLEKLTSSAGGAQQDRVDGGMGGLADRWAEALQQGGTAVLLETPARAVEQQGEEVVVHTDAGSFRSSHLISTLPPALSAELDFRPAMPTDRQGWCHALVPGRVIKCFAIYDRPFWRSRGLSGAAVGDQPPVHVAFDATPPDTDKGILMGFIEGRQAELWRDRPERRQQAVLEAFTRFFGPEASSPVHYLDHDWTTETWSRGCYAGVAGPGVTTTVAPSARRPHGRVHWAGTETATHHNGYIEGAVLSGMRAADEVVSRLDPSLRAPAARTEALVDV